MYWLSTLKAMQCSKMRKSAGFASKIHLRDATARIKKRPAAKRKRLGVWADLSWGSLSGGRSGWGALKSTDQLATSVKERTEEKP
jgi:hypothetical protein